MQMPDHIGMAAQLAGQSLRFGWYFGLSRLATWRTKRLGLSVPYRPSRPVPSLQELLAELGALLLSDAAAVRDGLYPPMRDEAEPFPNYMARVAQMFADLPSALERRRAHETATASHAPGSEGLPAYFRQDFHFQSGGYLTEDSARLYDVQVETLFLGAAGPMRRAALRPLAEFMRSRDQRRVTLLDVACGTGRFLRQVRETYPAMQLKGLDLSQAYLHEARQHVKGLRPVEFIAANAEDMPLANESVDVVTSIFLYHELPPEVRRRVTGEIARILRPGGLFVFIDSLQIGDRPGWDGLLEAFPKRFHEPFYEHYVNDDLDGMFAAAGLAARGQAVPYLSKMLVRTKN
jgi:ubiquinone/menaquinone biosynthesis C-methylase UbiE